jgi:hypothetical protein
MTLSPKGLSTDKQSRLIPMPNKLEEDVRSAYARANEGAAQPEELLTAVRVLVRNLKSEGRPPENVIVTIKSLCGVTHMTAAADTDSSVDGSAGKKLSDIVVSTVIDEYYATSSAGRRHPWQGYSVEIGDELR